MKPRPDSKPVITLPGEGEMIHAYGDEVRIHLGGAHNGGRFTMFTDTTPPGSGPPPHFHAQEDEWFHVLSGEAEFFDGAKWAAQPVGATVFMPRGNLHAFRNAGQTPLRQLIHTAPSAFEDFFRESQAEFKQPGGPDMQRILAIGARHHIYFPGLTPAGSCPAPQPTLKPVITKPDEGHVLRAFGEEVTILLDSQHTDGAFTSFLEVTAPGGGPPPHLLAGQDEWLFVLGGQVSFFAEGRWTDAPVGTALFAPPDSIHTFKNIGTTPSRILVHVSPGGLEKFFAEAHAAFARASGPDMNRAVEIAGKHGIRFAAV